MSWLERLREAAYTSPSGRRVTFEYTDVTRAHEKKSTAYEFPNLRGTYVQDLGTTGGRYPLLAYFSGPDCDLAAELFESLILESGVGLLEHPLYGQRDVVPVGAVVRRDDLVTAANQAVVQVELYETISLEYPAAPEDAGAVFSSALEGFNATAAEAYAGVIDTTDPGAFTALKNQLQQQVTRAKAALLPLSDGVAEAEATYLAIDRSINAGLDTLIGEPLRLGHQTLRLLQAPSRSAALISDKLSAYANLAAALTGGPVPGSGVRSSNEFHTNRLSAMGAVVSAASSVVFSDYSTQAEARAAAVSLTDLWATVSDWSESSLLAMGALDPTGYHSAANTAVGAALSYLSVLSSSLRVSRVYVLPRDRSLIDLAAELYGDIGALNELITVNNLTGQEVLIVPRGRAIEYFV